MSMCWPMRDWTFPHVGELDPFFKWLISKRTLCVECMYLPLMIFIINIVNNILLSCTYNKCALSQRIVCYKWLDIIMMYLNSINHIFFLK